jgi:class 3 adenylate cyclase
MRSNAGRFGDGLLGAFGAPEPDAEARAAAFRVAHVLNLIEAALSKHG